MKTEEPIRCVKCNKALILNKNEIMECDICHNKFCYDCSLDYTVWYSETIICCKKCALEKPADWLKQTDVQIDRTDEPLK